MVFFFVTGFGPFAGVPTNPTQELIALLDEQIATRTEEDVGDSGGGAD